MNVLFHCVILLFLTSCCRPLSHYPVYQADEFVIDSYQIKQGKLSILEMQGVEVREISELDMLEYKDVIAEDDILTIAVYHPTRKDLMQSIQFINDTVGGFPVHQGKVDIPDIPPVSVAGLSLEEARIKLQKQFQTEIQDVEVFVTYKNRLSHKVELTGMVSIPTVPVDGKIRLYEVLAKAHIPHNANLYMSYVSRDGFPLGIDLHKLINQGDMSQNIVMRGGDKIFIANPNDANVMLLGELRSPRAVPVPYGSISLREALVQAGGIPYTGDTRHIQVIRGNLQCPKIYELSWEHIVCLPNDSLLLMPGDTVYVSEKPITQWNRFIEQLLPSFSGVQAGFGIYQISTN